MANVFEQIVDVTEDYLGPTARRFVSRQIVSHLDKQPDEVTTADIPTLADWTQVTLSLLTQDKAMIHEYTEKMKRIGRAA